MRVYVNDQPIDLLPGMTVRHALIASGQLEAVREGKRVFDQWDNEVGLDGALTEGARIFVR